MDRFQKGMDQFEAWQKIIRTREKEYDEKFFASVGIHKVNGKYDPEDLELINKFYVKKYESPVSEIVDNSITSTVGYHWERRNMCALMLNEQQAEMLDNVLYYYLNGAVISDDYPENKDIIENNEWAEKRVQELLDIVREARYED